MSQNDAGLGSPLWKAVSSERAHGLKMSLMLSSAAK